MLVEQISQLLWDFGFRHHEELQTKWVDGVAGLGMVAQLTDSKPTGDAVENAAMEFLEDTNPQLLEAVRSASQEDKEKLLSSLETNFRDLQNLINALRKEV